MEELGRNAEKRLKETMPEPRAGVTNYSVCSIGLGRCMGGARANDAGASGGVIRYSLD